MPSMIGPSSTRARSFGFVGDWPCLAEMMIAVLPARPCARIADQSRERVRRERRHCLAVFQAMVRERGELRSRVRPHVPGEILLVQPVDGNQQHVPDSAGCLTLDGRA
jgi:hypothetical protein